MSETSLAAQVQQKDAEGPRMISQAIFGFNA